MSFCTVCNHNFGACTCQEIESITPAEIQALREENAILRSQVENADINLEQVRMAQKAMWRTKLESAESEIARLANQLDRWRIWARDQPQS